MISWVVGRGGLLGKSVERALRDRGPVWVPERSFSWHDQNKLKSEFSFACYEFSNFVGEESWQIAWCAGAGIVGSNPEELDAETQMFSGFLELVAESFQSRLQKGAFFYASSAGGVYAGVGVPPYSESSPTKPISPYGWQKLSHERLIIEWGRENSIPCFIGRLSNLYGPNQSVTKHQGLITQIFLNLATHQALQLYVPLDTIRDYLYADDAGQIIANGLHRLHQASCLGEAPDAVVKILASQQPVTIATVLAQIRWITKRPVKATVGTTSNTRLQARDLRMISSVWTELDCFSFTPFSHGLRLVMNRILQMSCQGEFSVGKNSQSSLGFKYE